jgi:hypothetical protein
MVYLKTPRARRREHGIFSLIDAAIILPGGGPNPKN